MQAFSSCGKVQSTTTALLPVALVAARAVNVLTCGGSAVRRETA